MPDNFQMHACHVPGHHDDQLLMHQLVAWVPHLERGYSDTYWPVTWRKWNSAK